MFHSNSYLNALDIYYCGLICLMRLCFSNCLLVLLNLFLRFLRFRDIVEVHDIGILRFLGLLVLLVLEKV